jgi:hypothetical protein
VDAVFDDPEPGYTVGGIASFADEIAAATESQRLTTAKHAHKMQIEKKFRLRLWPSRKHYNSCSQGDRLQMAKLQPLLSDQMIQAEQAFAILLDFEKGLEEERKQHLACCEKGYYRTSRENLELSLERAFHVDINTCDVSTASYEPQNHWLTNALHSEVDVVFRGSCR